jgi:addiction module HigA family antidote
MMPKTMDPIHPGEILFEEFLEPLHLSQNRLANAIGVPPRRINEIVLGSGESLPTPPFACLGSLEQANVSG